MACGVTCQCYHPFFSYPTNRGDCTVNADYYNCAVATIPVAHKLAFLEFPIEAGILLCRGMAGIYCPSMIEREAECCSLNALGALTDEHYCDPAAATRSMHSDVTHSQMWVGSGLTSKAHGPIYSNLHSDSNGKNRTMSLLAAHICCCAQDQ